LTSFIDRPNPISNNDKSKAETSDISVKNEGENIASDVSFNL